MLLDASKIEGLLKASSHELNAHNCKVSQIDASKFPKKLRKLDISWNRLGSLREGIRTSLPHLRVLNASSNKLTEVVELPPAVETVLLHDNRLSSVPSLASCSHLKTLRLDRNRIKSAVGLTGCQSLTMLDLSGNLLTSLSGLASLTRLVELNVSSNKLTSFIPTLGCRSVLQELRANDNHIDDIAGLNDFSSLQTVSLARNRLKRLPSDTFLLANLGELDLSHNKLASIERLDQIAPHLDVLDLASNSLDDLDTLVDTLKNLQHLAELSLDGNPLVVVVCEKDRSLLQTCRAKLPNLQVLDNHHISATTADLKYRRHLRGSKEVDSLEDMESKAASFRDTLAALKLQLKSIRRGEEEEGESHLVMPRTTRKREHIERARSFSSIKNRAEIIAEEEAAKKEPVDIPVSSATHVSSEEEEVPPEENSEDEDIGEELTYEEYLAAVQKPPYKSMMEEYRESFRAYETPGVLE